MKNFDIHKGLDKRDLRDFIGKYIFNDTGEHYIKSMETQVAELMERIKKARIAMGIREVATVLGWEGFDVSGDIEDYDRETYISFIGTVDEYNKQITKGSS